MPHTVIFTTFSRLDSHILRSKESFLLFVEVSKDVLLQHMCCCVASFNNSRQDGSPLASFTSEERARRALSENA